MTDPDFQFWQWVHEHRRELPPFFEEGYISSLRHHFLSGTHSFVVPPDGVYVVTAAWSGPARMVETAFRSQLATRSMPLPVSFLSTDSTDIDTTFPQLRPFLHGWGEVFGFVGGRCDLFFAPGQHTPTITEYIDAIYQHYDDHPRPN